MPATLEYRQPSFAKTLLAGRGQTALGPQIMHSSNTLSS